MFVEMAETRGLYMSALECEDIGAYYAYRDFEDRERNAKEKSKGKKQTNADKIRNMTDEELADWLCRHIGTCTECVAEDMCEYTGVKANGLLKWLRQGAET